MSDDVDRRAFIIGDHPCFKHYGWDDPECTECFVAEECCYRTD